LAAATILVNWSERSACAALGPASIYRNVCLSVCLCVSTDYKKVVEVALTTLRPGWRQVILYKCTAAGGQFICVAVQLVQAKCVCCTCVRTAFYHVAVIF
jgi:hypothetical protein